MKGKVRRRLKARQDLIDIFRNYAREAGLTVARRFNDEAEATITRLAAMPGMGTRYEAENPAFGELRFLPIGGAFGIYLVFYRPTTAGIEVARVLHGARDIDRILFDEGK